VFPVFSLVLFCLVFTAMLVRVFRMSRAETEHLARLPFDAAPSARREAGR
jgi:hypothetical protein